MELNEPTRSFRYNVTETNTNENDYVLEQGWYRSVSGAGGDIPGHVEYTGQCNAYAPIWLTGNILNYHFNN